MKQRIAVLDDDIPFNKLLCSFLAQHGFEAEGFAEPDQFFKNFESSAFDCLILDVMLPGNRTGFDICKEIRERNSIPVIHMSARGDSADKIAGLRSGADDYIAKPFDPDELLLRLQILLRRIHGVSAAKKIFNTSQGSNVTEKGQTSTSDDDPVGTVQSDYSVDDLTLSIGLREARLNKVTLQLSATEFDLLVYLVTHPLTILTRDQLFQAVYGHTNKGSHRAIDLQMSRIRSQLQDDTQRPTWIKTVWGKGYIFMRSKKS